MVCLFVGIIGYLIGWFVCLFGGVGFCLVVCFGSLGFGFDFELGGFGWLLVCLCVYVSMTIETLIITFVGLGLLFFVV